MSFLSVPELISELITPYLSLTELIGTYLSIPELT